MFNLLFSKSQSAFLSLMVAFFAFSAAGQADSVVLASAVSNGRAIVNWFLSRTTTIDLFYPTACSYYGVLIFSEAIKDTSYRTTTNTRYRALGSLPGNTGNVDVNVHGIVPFELYRQTKYAPYLAAGKRLADDEFSPSHLRSDTLSTYSRFWVDDMYMIGSLQTQAYKSTDSARYLSNAARTLYRYIDSLQQPGGLFFHRPPDAHYYWGRGNGWGASAMTELLQVIPGTHPRYNAIMTAYRQQMQALIKCQDKAGMWHQLLTDTTSFKESSCTAMFVFALATGIKKGWLQGDTFTIAAKKGWMALASCLDPVQGLRFVCTGLNASGDSISYRTHSQATGDSHGTAAFIWAATAMVRLLTPSPQVPVATRAVRQPEAHGKPSIDGKTFDLRGRWVENRCAGRGAGYFTGRNKQVFQVLP